MECLATVPLANVLNTGVVSALHTRYSTQGNSAIYLGVDIISKLCLSTDADTIIGGIVIFGATEPATFFNSPYILEPKFFNQDMIPMIIMQEFFYQLVSLLISDGQRYTRDPLGAKGSWTCSVVQQCQVNWQIIIPPGRLALQINTGKTITVTSDATTRERVNFNVLYNPQDSWMRTMECDAEVTKQPIDTIVHIKFWIDNIKLWETSIYAREQAIIASNSLSDLYSENPISFSSLESIVEGRKHYGIFKDIPDEKITAASINCSISDPITFSGVLDLNHYELNISYKI
ncbi:MAG: hypothetical protein EZS28_015056 [Streblomastix strix]|uniref:Uncharacterized protein n=1 Tax=Streblomastix strix TaxID=222440 RepID=A0A5J4W3F8_9EUKA|nr:MAG: hypothetical protein EZS28_015056 [Streblomastix strix]